VSYSICLGEIVTECFAEQPGVSRAEVKSWAPLPGGFAANVACALAKLGNSVEFIGAVGQDHWGRALVQLLTDMNVGTAGIQKRLKAPTRKVYLLSDEGGEPTFAGFSEGDPAVFADAHVFANALNGDLFQAANFLVLGTFLLAYEDGREAVEKAIDLANLQNALVFVDINWRPMYWPSPLDAPGRIYDLLQKAHFLKLSEDEADWLFGSVSAEVIAHQLPHLKGVLVTLVKQGCRYYFQKGLQAVAPSLSSGISGQVSGFNVDVEDTSGASEAFVAGFISRLIRYGPGCLLDEKLSHQVVTYACAVAALTTTRLGAIAALPTKTEIEAFLYLN